MPLLVGLLVVIGSMLTGYTMHGGKIGPLLQISEFIIIGGAGFGAVIIGSGFGGIKTAAVATRHLLSPMLIDRAKYVELLELLFTIFNLARQEGVLSLEKHADNPASSDIFSKFPGVAKIPHSISFICDSLRMILVGGISDGEMSRIMENDLDIIDEEALVPSGILATLGDSMPAFGIVAAVLGVVITMQSIGGSPESIGEKVAAALVGTFLGVLLAYGIFNPIAKALENRVKEEDAFLRVIRYSMDAFARGYAAKLCIEVARRNIAPQYRPTFEEAEKMAATKVASAASK